MKDTAKTRRVRLMQIYGKKCMKCGHPLHLDEEDRIEGETRRAVTHHIVHRKNKGSDRLENQELRCLLCEMEAHGMNITEKIIIKAYQ